MPKSKTGKPSAWHAHVKKYQNAHPGLPYTIAMERSKATYKAPTKVRASRALTDQQKAANQIKQLKKKFNLVCTQG